MNKKRKIKSILIFLLVIGIGLFTMNLCFELTHTLSLSNGTIKFDDPEKGIVQQELSWFDEQILKGILNYKILYTDSPSCGLSERASISFDEGDRTFYIAQDTCSVIYDVKEDKCFWITPIDKVILYAILGRYGASFPCV